MEMSEDYEMCVKIFCPGYLEEIQSVVNCNKRFVYYTSADTALRIIRNKEIWFRSATVMNDFFEIAYGLHLIHSVFLGGEGQIFKESVEDIFEGIMEEVIGLLLGWQEDWINETYISCVSVHDPEEDRRGRLSMWRAYGNTALVLKNTPMTRMTESLAVFSCPVLYLTEDGMRDHISNITNNILINRRKLKGKGREKFISYIHNMLFRFAIATKHPGFQEEAEWRLFYRPTEQKSPAMSEEVVTLGGVPQKVYKLQLANKPEIDLIDADIPSLLDRVIIGPTQFPYVSRAAFVDVFDGLGVTNSVERVVLSDIPLRVN